MNTIYYTRFNGGRPYKISIQNNIVSVFNVNSDIEIDDYTDLNQLDKIYNKKAKFTFKTSKIFIGESLPNECTISEETCSKEFDGNTILLQLDDKKTYIYIGERIFSFKHSQIISFESPVCNSDIPSPFGIDCNKQYINFTDDESFLSDYLHITKCIMPENLSDFKLLDEFF